MPRSSAHPWQPYIPLAVLPEEILKIEGWECSSTGRQSFLDFTGGKLDDQPSLSTCRYEDQNAIKKPKATSLVRQCYFNFDTPIESSRELGSYVAQWYGRNVEGYYGAWMENYGKGGAPDHARFLQKISKVCEPDCKLFKDEVASYPVRIKNGFLSDAMKSNYLKSVDLIRQRCGE